MEDSLKKDLETLEDFDYVEVLWTDTTSEMGWVGIEETMMLHPQPIRTVGYILRLDKDELVLARGVAGGAHRAFQAMDPLVIPQGCVDLITVLKEGGEIGGDDA